MMPGSDSYISSNAFFISCPDQMFSVLLKYCEKYHDSGQKMMKHKFKPVDADCPRHHCLYGEVQADGKSG